MSVISPTIFTLVPPSLEVVYYTSLPGFDKKNKTQLGFPLSYFSKEPLSPDTNVLIPTTTVEVNNRDYINKTTFNFTSGYSSTGSVTDVSFQSPLNITLYKDTPYNYSYVSIPIKIQKIESDSAHSWYPILTNGLVYRDIIVTQEELDYSIGVTGSSSWLRDAGFIAGDILRCFYTITEEAMKRSFCSEDIIHFSDSIQKTVKNGEGFHSENGEIFFGSSLLETINSVAEVSTLGIKTIFQGLSITSPYRGSSFEITQVNLNDGELVISPAPDPGALLSVTYQKRYTGFSYRGFYNEKTNIWQKLDLNPSEGRIYNSGIDTTVRVSKSTSQLLNKSVYIYALPTAAIKLDSNKNFIYPIKYYSVYKDGNKSYSWSSIRHFIPDENTGTSISSTSQKQASSWGYAIYDQDYYANEVETTARDRGIPLYQSSAILIGVLRATLPLSESLEDARRFSGLSGVYDRQQNNTLSSQSFWDIDSITDINLSTAGAVLVEVEQALLDKHSMAEIETVVSRHLPPGIDYIIRKK